MSNLLHLLACVVVSFAACIGLGLLMRAAQAEVEANAIQREHACEYRAQRDDLRDYLARRDKVAWEPRDGWEPWVSPVSGRVVLWRWSPEGKKVQ